MKRFLLVFEDLLDVIQKSVTGPFKAESREALALRLELKRKTKSPQGCLPTYWDGKMAGDVTIYIVLMREHHIQTPEDLQKTAQELHCDWY